MVFRLALSSLALGRMPVTHELIAGGRFRSPVDRAVEHVYKLALEDLWG